MKPRKCRDRAMLGKIGICRLCCIPCKEVPDTDCPNSDKYVNKFAEAVKKAMEDKNE